MNILFLTNAYPDFDTSYRGIFVKRMATLLKDEGYSIAVVTPKIYKKSRYFEDQSGIKVYRFPFLAGDKLLIEYRKIPYLRMLLYHISGFFISLYVVFKNRCDLIHVHWAIPTGLVGVWIGRLLRKPIIVTIHGSDFRMATERFSFLTKIFSYVCRRANQIICVSDLQKNEIKRMGVKAEKISTIPMGIDETFLEAGRKRKEKLSGESPIVLSNRNLLPIYNLALLIRAIPIVLREEPQARFLIAGDGAEKGVLERDVRNLNMNSSVKFLGRVLHTEMPDLLAQSDIYVSTSYFDGASVSLLEALAAGAFPVVTDIPSNREWVSDGNNGFLVPQEDENLLAKKIVEAIRNQRLVRQASAKNREIVEERAYWGKNIRRITELYQNFV